MLFNPKKRIQAAAESGDTHGGNGGTVAVPKANQEVVNNDLPDELFDPEDLEGGDTHTPITASKKPKVKAATDEQNISTLNNEETDPAAGYLPVKEATKGITVKEVKAETCEQNISTIDNDVDPAAGYLPENGMNASAEDDDEFDLGDDDSSDDEGEAEDGPTEEEDADANGEPNPEEEEIDATDEGTSDTLQNQQQNDPCMTVTADEEVDDDGSEEGDDAEFGEGADEPDDEFGDDDEEGSEDSASEFLDDVEPGADEGDDEFADEDDEGDIITSDDGMNLMDVDGTDDKGDNVAFATIGASVHVIKSNRIVASMNKRIAANAQRSDVYLTPQFQEVVAMEMEAKGLRKGLKAMGFELAQVNVTASKVVEARISKGVKLQASAIRQVQAEKTETMKQCLAIASVGVAKGYFKDVENPLFAALANELQVAGFRNGSKMLKRVFAAEGFAFNQAVFETAEKLSGMSSEVRAGFTAALDMTSESITDNPFGQADGDLAEDDVDASFGADESMDDEFINDDVEQSPVNAFTQPGTKARLLSASTQANRGNGKFVSASVQDVLQGKRAFPGSFY